MRLIYWRLGQSVSGIVQRLRSEATCSSVDTIKSSKEACWLEEGNMFRALKETSDVLVVYKPAGVPFHADPDGTFGVSSSFIVVSYDITGSMECVDTAMCYYVWIFVLSSG